MKLSLLLVSSLISSILFSQTLTRQQEQVTRALISHHYHDEGKHIQLNLGEESFCFLNKDTFFNPPGYHYIFKLSHDTLLRLDKSKFHGNNFNRYLFGYKNKLHILGGYGMYITHNNLEIFNLNTCQWSIATTKGEKPNFILGLALKRENSVYSFYNYKSGSNAEPDEFDNYIYKLNLDNLTWERYENINLNPKLPIESIYTQNFALGIFGNQVIIINKNNLKYLVLGKEEVALGMLIGKYDIDKDEIITERGIVNVDALWAEKSKLATPFILEPSWYQIPQIQLLIYIVLIVIILGLIIWYFVKRKRNLTNNIEQELFIKNAASNPIAEKLIGNDKATLDIDELDALLEINHMEFDSRKLKRHRLLSDLEKQIRV